MVVVVVVAAVEVAEELVEGINHTSIRTKRAPVVLMLNAGTIHLS